MTGLPDHVAIGEYAHIGRVVPGVGALSTSATEQDDVDCLARKMKRELVAIFLRLRLILPVDRMGRTLELDDQVTVAAVRSEEQVRSFAGFRARVFLIAILVDDTPERLVGCHGVIAIDQDGKLFVADRSNKRVQIFTPDGEFLDMWTGMGGPNDITRAKDGTFYIAEQEDVDRPAYVCVRNEKGDVLAKLESRHVHGVGVDSHGDIYAGLTVDRGVDKFVRTG